MTRKEALSLIEGLYLLEINRYPKETPGEIFAENLLSWLEQEGLIDVQKKGYDE